jgi:hypothetical protein
MPNYDFHTLSPVDFEELTRDLLQASEGIVFQSFKDGRDRGIDLRYAKDDENRIVQCKHYRKSGYRPLLRDLRREAVKIARMAPAPTRYLLSTSVELSDDNKKEIAAVLGIKDTGDILGSGDLNNRLGVHPDVQTRHYKLWLASTEVLQRVLNSAEVVQSDFEFRRIASEVPRFVQTRAYSQAADILARNRVLVLSGLPGVGKSTIADFLVYEKVAEGFQPVIARNGFDEARTLYREGVRQVFFYDDFLGATFLGEGGSAFVRNEDRAITDFLKLIANDEDKLLIVTTREHILSDALETSERLRHSSIRDHRYVVWVGTYSAEQRARILYNHAYFNGLGPAYLDRLLAHDFFLKVVEHPKFSPRVIEWLTTPRRVKAVAPSDYQTFAIRLLDDPTEVWRHAYQDQISHAGRSALLALHSLNGRVSHSRMSEAFDVLHATRAARYGFKTAPDDFLRSMRVLSGAFVTITRTAVDFIDPSVRDLMNSLLHEAPDNCLDILRGAVSMIQVSAIWTFAEMRDGEHIQARIEAALPSLVEGFHRALSADLFAYGEGAVGVYASAIETRLTLLADIAGSLDNRALDPLIAPTVERTLQVWRTEKPDVSPALQAIELLGQQNLAFQPAVQRLRRQLMAALAIQTEVDLEPNEMLRFMKLADGSFSGEELTSLRGMALRWSDMGDRLRNCGSDYELERLVEQLREVAAGLDVDLRGPIQKVDVERHYYEDAEEEPPPEPQRPDPRDHTSEAERAAVRSLFATLRQVDNGEDSPSADRAATTLIDPSLASGLD